MPNSDLGSTSRVACGIKLGDGMIPSMQSTGWVMRVEREPVIARVFAAEREESQCDVGIHPIALQHALRHGAVPSPPDSN
jgi:hypothetical protein